MTTGTRFLCWDKKWMEKNDGVSILPHHPTKRNIALLCDDEWEGVHNGYSCVIKVGDTYRMYYRAANSRHQMDGTMSPGQAVICMAESRDGITFTKPDLQRVEYNGTKHNNIIFAREQEIDNFSVLYDTNPDCPEDERFKGLAEGHDENNRTLLYIYASRAGIDFRPMYPLEVKGTFDSYNLAFWNEITGQYHLYYRAFHSPEGKDKLSWNDQVDAVKDIRDVRFATSKDFKTWTEHGRIQFEEGQGDCPLYTNQIAPYYRDKNTLLGFPVRYLDRGKDKANFKFMPLGDRHEKVTEKFGREGTSVTDCVIMTSTDGLTFDRRDEAFLTPGVENRNNWWYGNCYITYGLVETKAEEEGAPNEISLYTGENYRIKNVNFRRYTIRLDGFFSWYAPFAGGTVLTKPVPVKNDTLRINFASSALGGLMITLCNEAGEELEGYRSYTIFGDSVDRPVEFEKPLSDLKGKSVRLKISLSDAHLYSFHM